jgi:hypothetical protein
MAFLLSGLLGNILPLLLSFLISGLLGGTTKTAV